MTSRFPRLAPSVFLHRPGPALRCGLSGLILAGFLGASALTAQGRIVPVPEAGVTVKAVAGQPAAFVLVGPVRTIVSAVTGEGFLIVRLMLDNRGDVPVTVGSEAVRVVPRERDAPAPISPERYVEMRFQVNPHDLDSTGNPKSRRGMVNHAGPSAGSTGDMLDRSMYDDGRDSSWADDEVQAGRILKELKGNRIYGGGRLAPGERSQERIVFQRNHVTVPFDLTIQLGGHTRIVHFDRE